MAAPHAPFMKLWWNHLPRDERIRGWAYAVGIVPTELVARYRGTALVHVEEKSLHKPNCEHLNQMIGPDIYDWSSNYAMHLWYRRWKQWGAQWYVEPTPENIKKRNTTFGQMARYIYYGSSDLL